MQYQKVQDTFISSNLTATEPYYTTGVVSTRHQNECTLQYPEMKDINLPSDCILDGEMIVLDEQAKPCFKSVMQRFQARKEKAIKHLTKSNPAYFVAFDVLGEVD
jgi:ATP-dependent DNA ligase